MFLNRKNELADLDHRYQSGQAEFIVLWGRRRVGKTSLVWEFCQDKPALFYFSERASSDYLLREFSQQIKALDPDVEVADDFSYADWYSAFQQLEKLATDQRMIVVIDEFPILQKAYLGLRRLYRKRGIFTSQKAKFV